jgi:hypothetical protein
MADSTLDQVQRLVDRLTPLDQVRLLTYLTSRVARVMESIYPAMSISTSENTASWQEFFRLGDALTTNDTAESPTLTAAVLKMRR